MSKLALVVDWPNANVPWRCWASIWNSDIRREPDVGLLRGVSPDSGLSTNMVVKVGLEWGADEFLFLAADQTVPRDVLARFRAHDKPIVGALTATRQANSGHHWLIHNFTDNGAIERVVPTEPLQKVDVIGPGCMYVKAEVFRKLQPPWFKQIVSPDGCELIVSNDFYFFALCKQAGIEVYIDSTVESDHEHEVVLNAKSLHRNAPFLVEIHETKVAG